VRAVGNNFQFTGASSDWGTSPLPTLGRKSSSELGQTAPFEQTRWSGVFHREGVRVEITVVSGDDVHAVLINHHRDTDPSDYQQAVAAAKQFAHDREVSEHLLRSLLSQEVKK